MAGYRFIQTEHGGLCKIREMIQNCKDVSPAADEDEATSLRADRDTRGLFPAKVLDQSQHASHNCKANQNDQSRFVVAREKTNDVSSIKRSQAGNDRVANQAAQRQSAEEFF